MSLVARDVAVARGGRYAGGGAVLRRAAGRHAGDGAERRGQVEPAARILAGLAAPATGVIERPDARALMAEQAALDPELPLAAALGFWPGWISAATCRTRWTPWGSATSPRCRCGCSRPASAAAPRWREW
ncbi:hypothetical protein AB5I41_22995 [Sphingomonas sp. MMS24-JH45]